MFYVYCLQSTNDPDKRTIGFTEDLRQRVRDHNRGCNPATVPYRPWKLRGYIAFESKQRALAFERHLKRGSGHAFAKRRLWQVAEWKLASGR